LIHGFGVVFGDLWKERMMKMEMKEGGLMGFRRKLMGLGL